MLQIMSHTVPYLEENKMYFHLSLSKIESTAMKRLKYNILGPVEIHLLLAVYQVQCYMTSSLTFTNAHARISILLGSPLLYT
jgi:hypothetical protein